jgi:hypothetical protein
MSMDLLGNVTPIGVFVQQGTGELSLTTNGTSTVVTTVAPFAGDIRAASAKDIWIVPRAITAGGSNKPYFVGSLLTSQFAHWDGASWTVLSAPAAISGALTAFWVETPDLWVAAAPPAATSGAQPVIYRWQGGTWSAVPSPLDASPTAEIAAMWGEAADDLWAGGKVAAGPGPSDPIRAFLMHWDGTSWSRVTPSVLSQDWQSVMSIWGTSSRDVWFGGVDTGPVILDAGNAAGTGNIWHFDGTTWVDERLQITISNSIFFGLWGTGPTDLWASGDDGVRHYDGKSWNPGPTPNYRAGLSNAETLFDQVKGTASDGLWGAGDVDDFGACGGASSKPLPTLLHLQANLCGDGALGACEECDPPQRPQSGLQCGCDCHYLRCGNGIIDPGEDCDPPGTDCDSTCHFPTCGNHKLDPGEQCDPPDGITCDSQCQNIPIVCGNGIVQPGEQCDAPNGATCQNCTLTCCGVCLNVAVASAGTCSEPEACSRLAGQDRDNCYALLNCLFHSNQCSLASEAFPFVPPCYCTQWAGGFTSCLTYGPCAAQYQAVAKSTDDAEIESQAMNASTTLGAVSREPLTVAGWSCGEVCFVTDPPQPSVPPGCPL